jgi:hypothetical protein
MGVIDEGPSVKTTDLQRFLAVAETLHFPRTAQDLGVPLPALYSSIERLEEEIGSSLISRDGAKPALTPAGALFVDEARRRVQAAPAPAPKAAPAGGKAKANKGKGRAPIVKGQPKPYKKRQGR